MSIVNIVMCIFPDFSLHIKAFLIQKWGDIINIELSLISHILLYLF